MKGLVMALFLALGFAASNGQAAAVDTATPGPAASADAASLPRFGYIRPVAQSAENQPSLDDFANAVTQQVQQAFSVALVGITGAGLKGAIAASSCDVEHLSGFIVSHKTWGAHDTVQVEAMVRIVDCQGKPFHSSVGTFNEKRNESFSTEGQVAAVQSKAIAVAVSELLDYRNSHDAVWQRLVRTGSVDAASPSPTADSPTPHPNF